MTPPPEGTPWWVWLLAVLVVTAITAGSTVLAARRAIRPTSADVAAIREQVQNAHTTNLREDLDTIRTELVEVKALAANAAAGSTSASLAAHRAERFASDLAVSLRSVEHSLDRRDQRLEREITSVRDDLTRHTATCPPRSPRT